jgi:hypothetical protein
MAGAGLIGLIATFHLLKGELLEYSVAAGMSASAFTIVVLGIPYLRVWGANIYAGR